MADVNDTTQASKPESDVSGGAQNLRVPPWGPTPVKDLRRRPPNGRCETNAPALTMATTLYDIMNAKQLDAAKLQVPLRIAFHLDTWRLAGMGYVKRTQRPGFFSKCPARCETLPLLEPLEKADSVVFNQDTSAAKSLPKEVIKVAFSLEQLGQFWKKRHFDNGAHLRMSNSLVGNQSEISVPHGCKFLRHCTNNRCPADFQGEGRPLLPGNESIGGPVVSIISNGVRPRSTVLKALRRLVKMDNYGTVGKNKKSAKLASRTKYADGSKLNIFRSYPFAYVPENKWDLPWGYVSEKAYDAYMAGTVPIWQGGLYNSMLPLYFPTARNQSQTLLHLLDFFPGFTNFEEAGGLARHIEYLLSNPDAYNQYLDWDPEWFRSGALRRSCESDGWCKLCVAVHVMKQGFCPPFM